jgi:acetyltransferase
MRSYSSQWQRHLVLENGWRIFVRPIKPDDEPFIHDLLVHVSKEDLRLRFFDSTKEFSHSFIAKLTQIDDARAMAFIAFDAASNEVLGAVWLYCDPNRETGEYAILVRSSLKGRGLGWALMQLIIGYAKSEGLKQMCGQILRENAVMLKMCRELGFESRRMPMIAVCATSRWCSKAISEPATAPMCGERSVRLPARREPSPGYATLQAPEQRRG